MANNLTEAQRTAFSDSYFREGDFIFTTTITKGSKSIDVSDYIISVLPIEDVLFNYSDRVPGTLEYPAMVIEFYNSGGVFSVGHSASTWIDDDQVDGIEGWELRTRLQETISTGSPVDLMPESIWYIADIEYSQGKATMTAIHPLNYHYHKIWNAERDSHAIQWTDSTTHYGPDWDYNESG